MKPLKRFYRRELTPVRVIVLGYLILVLVGTALLTLPHASAHSGGTTRVSFIDSLFTASSAVCVTGLIVKDTELDFSLFGKSVILVLIQIGGLGYMTISTVILIILGKKISLRQRLVIREAFKQLTLEDLGRFALRVFQVTILIEAVGFLLLFFAFLRDFSLPKAFGVSLFHSVSGFCNAGFSAFSNNLQDYGQNVTVVLTVAVLFILGGLGFFAFGDLYNTYVRRKTRRLSVHTKLVLRITTLLIGGGTLLFLALEWNNGLSHLPGHQKLLTAFFSAVTPRTAGFSVLNMRNLALGTSLFTIFFMFIGASPGGTGGGIKTTTLATLLNTLGGLRKGGEINVFGRRISEASVRNAFLVFLWGVVIVGLGSLILVIFEGSVGEKSGYIGILFEQMSAFGTVGLSFGSTMKSTVSLSHDFSVLGKLVIIATMLSGRIGPLTIGSALIGVSRAKVRYPEAKIMIG
jgi:trk system potassium uptake protein TrkH